MVGIVQHETVIRITCFASVVTAMVIWEALAPRRSLTIRRRRRWTSNYGLLLVNSMLARVVAPLGAVGVALFAESRGWGVFHVAPIPEWLGVMLSVILLDGVIYAQHVMFHAIPLLWRLHQVHHVDLDIDASTGIRFHTIEILLSLGLKAMAIVLLGAPAVAVLIFEVLLNVTSVFNHGNVRMPLPFDRVLRWIVVTPDMHRVHHSWLPRETNSNFGFNLPWWDRLFGTYRDQPAEGHLGMTIGLAEIRDEQRAERLLRMLWLPFERRRKPKPKSGLDDT